MLVQNLILCIPSIVNALDVDALDAFSKFLELVFALLLEPTIEPTIAGFYYLGSFLLYMFKKFRSWNQYIKNKINIYY